MKRLTLFCLALIACGSSGGVESECGVKATDYFYCKGTTQSYLCPASSAEDAKINEDIKAACQATAGSDGQAIVSCMQNATKEGKYKMAPGKFVEDCTASGKTCDWVTSGRCIDK